MECTGAASSTVYQAWCTEDETYPAAKRLRGSDF